MNDFFEQELQKLFGDGKIIGDPTYSGQACFGTLGKDLRARVEFVTLGTADQYEALRLTVLNRTGGQVDAMTLNLKDLLGVKPVPDNPGFPKGVAPQIWFDFGKADWHIYRPTADDYETIRRAAEKYLGVFRDHQRERTQDGPRLV